MRLLITRPGEDAAATKARLEARGHEAVLAPLLSIEYLANANIDLTGIQAVLITSANGVRALARLTDNRTVPLLCVGDASATTAHMNGFKNVKSANGDVHALADLVGAECNTHAGPLLHAAGENRAGDLKADLEARGFTVQRTALYRAALATALPPEAVIAFKAKKLDGVLLYSPRTARHFADLIRTAGLADHMQYVVAYSLSNAVTLALADLSFKSVQTAARPREDALFDLFGLNTPIERTPMSEPTSTTQAEKPQVTATATAKPAAAKPTPAKAKSGGRAGWIVAGLVIVLLAGAFGWGAVYSALPENVKSGLPAALQPGNQSAEQLAAFQMQADTALADVRRAAASAADAQNSRLAALEDELSALANANADLSSGLASVQNQLTALAERPEVRPEDILRLQNELTALRSDFTAVAAESIATRTLAAEAKADAAAALAAGADAPRRTAFAVAITGLGRAATSGQPFETELAAAMAQADEDVRAALTPLQNSAAAGVATAATLAARFNDLASAALRAEAVPDNAPWYEKLWARLKSIITVRPVGDVEGTSTGAVLARAEADLAREDIAGAAAELAALSATAANVFAAWQADAANHIAAHNALAQAAALAGTKSIAIQTEEVEQ